MGNQKKYDNGIPK